MAKLEVHEKTRYLEAMEIKERWIKNIGQYINARNSRFVSLSFRKDATLGEMPQLVNAFRRKLVEVSGIHPDRLYTVAVYMTLPHPHCHLVALSDKDRRTGRSIGNMSKGTVQGLFDWWHEQAGATGEWVATWDIVQLLDYLAGTNNMRRPGQKWAEETTNEKFLRRLHRRMEKRSTSENHTSALASSAV